MSNYEVHVSGDETINLSVETDPTQSMSTNTPEEVPMTFSENGTYALLVNDSPEYSMSPSSTIVVGGAVTSVNGMTGDVVLATSDLENDVGYLSVIDLGEFDPEDYDWDLWAYFAETTESGFYKAHDIQDGFDYFLRVERTENECYQEYWYTEENSLLRNCRDGKLYDGEWEWSEPTEWVTSENLYSNFYTKGTIDQKLSGKVDNDTLGNYYTDTQVDEILENNYYNMDTIDEMFEEFHPVAENMIESTWSNLVTLRNSSQLVKGAFYRITDYNFITTKANVHSGDHQFDVVVLAISENMLSESAYAVRHTGDHYFEREITTGGIEWFYTMYVDDMGDSYGTDPTDHSDDLHATDVFCDYDYLEHPDTGDTVPVLYKTNGEEYSIDDPDYDDAYFYEGTYDFDGDEYDMWSKWEHEGEDWVFKQQYALTQIAVEDGELIVSPIPETKTVPVNMNAWELKYCLDNDKSLFDWAATEGKGVIYYMKDEFGNEAPYDFKNALFQRRNITNVSSTCISPFTQGESSRIGDADYYAISCGSNSYWYYTFDTPYNAGHDSSLFGDSTYNVIMPYIYEGKRIINAIVLGFSANNYFGRDCFNITVWGSANNNRFEKQCNSFLAYGVSDSKFDRMRQCTFYSVSNCQFGNNSFNNVGNSLDSITTGVMCQNNNFAIGNNGHTIGNGFNNNTFGNYDYGNIFGNTVSGLSLGTYVSYNTFNGNNSTISLPNYTRYCTFEDCVSRVTFSTTGGSNSKQLQYVKVCKNVTNLSVAPTRNLSYETIYYKTGRQENAV